MEVRHGWIDLVQSTEALADPQPLEAMAVSRALCDSLSGVVALARELAAGMDRSGDVDTTVDDGAVGVAHLDVVPPGVSAKTLIPARKLA